MVVLSSNDGCVVARSNEAKALGIPMAAPAFKYRQLFKDQRVVQFSANFELYGDISRRITQMLTSITPRIEIYSVDESFLDLAGLGISDYGAWGRVVRETIWRWVGIPVSIGIGPTKTLAKLASDRGKKDMELDGVLDFIGATATETKHHLKAVPIESVWGVGWRLTPRLKAEGLMNAWQLSQLPGRYAQQIMGIHGRQMVSELNGTSCYTLELEGKARQSIARTRTFGGDTNDLPSIEAAIASFATQAAFRLRTDRQLTRRAALFLTTNKHKPGYRRWSREVTYQTPTADTGQLISSLLEQLGKMYRPSHEYHRAGVLLWDFVSADQLQADLFGVVNINKEMRAKARMRTVDQLNERFGKGRVHFAAEDLGDAWQPRRGLRSPRYVSRWDELPSANLS